MLGLIKLIFGLVLDLFRSRAALEAEILVVPTANPKALTATGNRLIVAPDERSLQVDLVRLDQTVQVADGVGSRDPGPLTPTQPSDRRSAISTASRAANCLKNDNITYIGDLVQKTEVEMLPIPNFGRKPLNEVREVLAQMGLRFGMEIPNRDDIQYRRALLG